MPRRGNGAMGRVMVDVTLINNHDLHLAAAGSLAADKVRQMGLKALVDTAVTSTPCAPPICF